jgi:hypothetical protein
MNNDQPSLIGLLIWGLGGAIIALGPMIIGAMQ